MEGGYKSKKSEAERLACHQLMLSKREGVIVIVERMASSKLPLLKNSRFFVSQEENISIVFSTLRSALTLKESESINIFTQKSKILLQTSNRVTRG
jgi:uncharacterized protein YehS (DUF1456 family)